MREQEKKREREKQRERCTRSSPLNRRSRRSANYIAHRAHLRGETGPHRCPGSAVHPAHPRLRDHIPDRRVVNCLHELASRRYPSLPNGEAARTRRRIPGGTFIAMRRMWAVQSRTHPRGGRLKRPDSKQSRTQSAERLRSTTVSSSPNHWQRLRPKLRKRSKQTTRH